MNNEENMHGNRIAKHTGLGLLLTGCLAASAWAAPPTGWELKYGTGQRQVGYYNDKVNPKMEEASPLGPMAFRLDDGELWLADSIGGRLLRLGSGGAPEAAMKVPGVGTDTLLEDIALVENQAGKVEAAWVADGADLFVRKLSVPAGKELARVGGRGQEPGLFTQIHQLEVGPTGRLYVGDFGRSVITVFDPAGKLLREIPWERSGFAIDAQERLSTIVYIEGSGYVWHQYSPEGRLEKAVHLGLPALQNPRLWWLDGNGGIAVSFIPAGGFRGVVTMHVFGPEGALLKRFSVKPAQGMNRYLARGDDGRLWCAVADLDKAPKGAFKIISLTAEGDK